MENENEKTDVQENESAIDNRAFELGLSHASYLAGFAFVFKTSLNMPDEIIGNIITHKMILEYQQEMKRMELETQEHMMEKQLEKIEIYGEDEY